MPKKVKKTKKNTKKSQNKKETVRREAAVPVKVKEENLFENFRIRESYTSLLLGIVVVIVASLIVVSFFKNNASKTVIPSVKTDTSNDQSKNATPQTAKSETYVVQEGDLLWDIAVKMYGDGFRWTEIAKANNLPYPDAISTGMKLVIPR